MKFFRKPYKTRREVIFKFYKKDIWIGMYIDYWDIHSKCLYICPLPCMVFRYRTRKVIKIER